MIYKLPGMIYKEFIQNNCLKRFIQVCSRSGMSLLPDLQYGLLSFRESLCSQCTGKVIMIKIFSLNGVFSCLAPPEFLW